ncbi:MAG: alpha/beta hydrolase [Pseudanabaena sp. RU_4_16]|nr:alpha/beta hydrolase [Pseudanabaena sp. RU_4_16]
MTTIYFATNRQPNRSNSPDDFGSNFSNDGLANLRFGKADVTGENFDRYEISVAPENLFADPPVLGSQAIFREVRQQMNQNAKDSVIFIHGFNVSFRAGLTAAAQLHQVLTANDPIELGNPLRLNICLFSWPSDGNLILTDLQSRDPVAYRNDRLDAQASGAAFARGFLKVADFINKTEPRCNGRLHLIAHSMGNYVLRHAMLELKKQVADQIPRVFDQVLMMAADEDDDAFDFEYKLSLLPRLTRRTSIYFNRNDLALWASDKFKGNPSRLGTDGPIKPQQLPRNVYPIDCTKVVSRFVDPAEHGYFTTVARVVTDMRQVLRNQSPDEILGRKYVSATNRYRLLEELTPQNS